VLFFDAPVYQPQQWQISSGGNPYLLGFHRRHVQLQDPSDAAGLCGATPCYDWFDALTGAGPDNVRFWSYSTGKFFMNDLYLLEADLGGHAFTYVNFSANVARRDFGDAPSSYGTVGASAAQHGDAPIQNRSCGEPRLGYLWSAESDGQPDPFALGDDSDDGVFLYPWPAMTIGELAYASVVARCSDGVLSAWFDWNGNGVFDHPAEIVIDTYRIQHDVPINWTFTVPQTAKPGVTFARFRFTTRYPPSPLPTGEILDGEVEDYAIALVFADFGDSEEPLTTRRFNGARHTLFTPATPYPLQNESNAFVVPAYEDILYNRDFAGDFGCPRLGTRIDVRMFAVKLVC